MIKKTTQAFAFFALIQILIFSCCEDLFNVYYNTIEFNAVDQVDFDTTTVASEDLVLNLNVLFDYVVASNFNGVKQFSNSAYATSCNEVYILKESVTNVEITANEDVFGISASNSLNEKLSYRNPETNENEVLENIIAVLNRQNGYGYDQLDIILNEPIDSGTSLVFTIQLSIEENNRILEASTELIIIE
mgnify:FL=1|jgi:hypothetical protein